MTDYTNIVPEPTEGYEQFDILVLGGDLSGHTHPRDVLALEITADTVTLNVFTQFTPSDGISIEVWSNRVRQFILAKGPGVIELDRVRAALADGQQLPDLIDAIKAGHEVVFDGRNMVGKLTTEAARDAEEELEKITHFGDLQWFADDWGIWNEGDWVHDEAKQKITATTTDEEIDAYLAEVRKNAPTEKVILRGDAREMLIEMRDERKADAEADAE